MNEELYRDVLGFIGRFSTKMDGSGDDPSMYAHFLMGCCYWFAYILSIRFADYSPVIVHDNVEAHFACCIEGRVYDIRGDITDMDYDWMPWDEYDDETHKKRILEQCINF